MATIIGFEENTAMDIMGSIYENLTEGGAKEYNSPFMKKLLRQILSSEPVLVNGKELDFAKIHEEIIDVEANTVKTEIIFANVTEDDGEPDVNFHFVLGVTSTVNNLYAKKIKYSDYKDIYCRMVNPMDITLYLSALKFSEKAKKYNHLLRMQVKLRNENGKLLGTF